MTHRPATPVPVWPAITERSATPRASRHSVFRAFATAALLIASAHGHADEPAAPVAATESPRYTFSWPLDSSAPAPRGGKTRGAPVVLDREPSAAWQALQAPALSARERDRRAILAMAGTYRVSFDFLEVDTYAPASARSAPYQSWGTEKVYVDRDDGGFVSLVHILEMRIVDANGAVSEPMVTKHWRQDWTYEPKSIVEYRGTDRWARRAVDAGERHGAWLQAVYQVDESPRYASIGRWQHSGSFSSWISADTWRPLPRREWSVRADYQVLLGTNRHTVGPTGWTQEENNLKAVLTDRRTIDPARPYVAREYGVARYERLRDADFAVADQYFERTRAFWDRVRDTWADAFTRDRTVTLRGPVDKLGLFAPLFARADQIDEAEGKSKPEEDSAAIHSALAAMGVFGAPQQP